MTDAPAPERATTVTMAFAHGGEVRTTFMLSVLGLFQATNELHPISGYITVQGGPMITTSRNIIARRFADDDAEWLWMIDTDIDFDPGILDRLLAAADPEERPIVGALLYGLTGEGVKIPHIYRIPSIGEVAVPIEPKPDTLMEVDGTGCGCLLIHRSVLDELGSYPFAQVLTTTCEYSEDLSFCIRARDAGHPIYVHTGITAGHTKPVRLT